MKEVIRQKAIELGFSGCGFTDANALRTEKPHLEEWLNNGYQASMRWMENHKDLRIHPKKLHPGTLSIIVVTMNYYPANLQRTDAPQIAKYAYGKDYHDDMRNRLRSLLAFIQETHPCDGRAFVDSAPVLERTLAEKAGLGWRGKNSLLVTKKGSYFLLGELFLSLAIEPDLPHKKSYCGTCSACVHACPTGAILSNGSIDSNKCLSYLTIEHKGSFPDKTNLHNCAFGCDICQDVCPWNNHATPTTNSHFAPQKELISLSQNEFKNLSLEKFNHLFRKSGIKRTKYEGFMRNIEHL